MIKRTLPAVFVSIVLLHGALVVFAQEMIPAAFERAAHRKDRPS